MAISADLGEALERFVESLVAKGRYGSKSEVIREGIRLVQEREARLAALDAMLEDGIRDFEEGRIHSAEDVRAELTKKFARPVQ